MTHDWVHEGMRHGGTGLWGLVLIAIGAIGIYVLSLPNAPIGASGFASEGQRIYYTGTTLEGPIPRTVAGDGMAGSGMMGDVACVDCHGEDGRGGRVDMMFRTVDMPDIRYSTLSATRSEDGTTVPGWTDDDIARAIRDGVEPDGQPLKAPMPRWDMTDEEITDVISWLKELSAR